jgi:hypothetical protein
LSEVWLLNFLRLYHTLLSDIHTNWSFEQMAMPLHTPWLPRLPQWELSLKTLSFGRSAAQLLMWSVLWPPQSLRGSHWALSVDPPILYRVPMDTLFQSNKLNDAYNAYLSCSSLCLNVGIYKAPIAQHFANPRCGPLWTLRQLLSQAASNCARKELTFSSILRP